VPLKRAHAFQREATGVVSSFWKAVRTVRSA